MSGREKTKRGKPPGDAKAGKPDAGYEPLPAANTALELCVFCMEHPSGPVGHAGFQQQVFKIPVTDRSYVRLACVFCGSHWVRRRINARKFEWLRIAD